MIFCYTDPGGRNNTDPDPKQCFLCTTIQMAPDIRPDTGQRWERPDIYYYKILALVRHTPFLSGSATVRCPACLNNNSLTDRCSASRSCSRYWFRWSNSWFRGPIPDSAGPTPDSAGPTPDSAFPPPGPASPVPWSDVPLSVSVVPRDGPFPALSGLVPRPHVHAPAPGQGPCSS